MIQKFDTEKESDDFIDSLIENRIFELLNCNCDGELIIIKDDKRIWKLKSFNDKFIIIIDLIN